MLAEGGNTAPLQAFLETEGAATTTDTTPAGPVFPGASATAIIETEDNLNNISLAGMLLPTNDGFLALNGVKIPYLRRGKSVVLYSPAYDAGTEINNELCDSIPGPQCGGAANEDPLTETGFVHIHPGTHGAGDLAPMNYDWHNPIAKITIRRMK